MPPTLQDDFDAAFTDLAVTAGMGASVTYKGGAAFPVVIADPSPSMLKIDVALGKPHLVRLHVKRSGLAPVVANRPIIGEQFIGLTGVKYTITDIEQSDPTDPDVRYVCRTTGVPS